MYKVVGLCLFLSLISTVSAQTQSAIRVNAGGSGFSDSSGHGWSADFGYNSGQLSNSARSASVAGTSNPILFKSARYSPSTDPELQYQFSLADGTYKVNLYFAETFFKASSKRIFDVQVQGSTLFRSLDIFAAVGSNHALVKSAVVSVTNGKIVIRFVHHPNADNPIVSGIEIIPAGSSAPVSPTIVTQPANIKIATGQVAKFSVAASGTAPLSYQWQRNGTNVRGATSSSYTTPVTATGDSGETFRVLVSNSAGSILSNSADLTVVTTATTPLSITTTSLAGGIQGTAYSASLVATGGTAPHTWSITSGSLPTRLSLSGSGQITGTPTTAGTSSFTVKVTDSSSPAQSATANLRITVATAETPLKITTTSLPDGQEGTTYLATVVATGGTTPYSWKLTEGALPRGLSLGSTTGEITGTPTATGTFPITIEVQDPSTPVHTASATLNITTSSSSASHCPTGQPCGATAPYCESYAPPTTTGATDVLKLPVGYGGTFLITSPGNYYLGADVSQKKSGIAVLTTSGSVDINLNGHTLTYGTAADGSGSSQIGEYGILMCNTGNLRSEGLASSYGSNGLCRNGGLSASNVTIENGNITQSPNASQYYDPSNCPGSGVHNGCAHPHDSIASHAILSVYNSGITIKHVSVTVQNVDSRPIMYQYQQPGSGMDIECNTIDDKVTRLNERSEAHAAIWSGNDESGTKRDMIQYNTIMGSPQNGIALGVGGSDPPGSMVQYNDIDVGYYQMPPQVSQGEMYSNDYALGVCMQGGVVQYNYIHSANSRGIGCIFGGDQNNEQINNNYVSAGEFPVNAEYGPNGQISGAAWTGGCEIDGGRGFEAKDSFAIQLYSNTLIENLSECGAGGIVLVELPCQSISCSSTATHSFSIHDNTIQIDNTSGSSTLKTSQDAACYILDTVQGNYSNYFSPILRDHCTSDGDYVTTDGYNAGDYFSFLNPTYAVGSHPLASGCGGSSGSYCGHMMHWQGQQGPPSDEHGFVFQDVLLASGASRNFAGDSGTPLARSAMVKSTYTVTAKNSKTLAALVGVTVTALDAEGNRTSCTTNSSGTCSLELNQESVSSPSGSATLTTKSLNPNSVTISAAGCTTLGYSLSVTGTKSETRTLTCQ